MDHIWIFLWIPLLSIPSLHPNTLSASPVAHSPGGQARAQWVLGSPYLDQQALVTRRPSRPGELWDSVDGIEVHIFRHPMWASFLDPAKAKVYWGEHEDTSIYVLLSNTTRVAHRWNLGYLKNTNNDNVKTQTILYNINDLIQFWAANDPYSRSVLFPQGVWTVPQLYAWRFHDRRGTTGEFKQLTWRHDWNEVLPWDRVLLTNLLQGATLHVVKSRVLP